MSSIDYLVILVSIFSGCSTAIFGWLSSRHTQEINALKIVVDTLTVDYQRIKSEVVELREENKLLRSRVDELENCKSVLEKENGLLKIEIESHRW